MPSPSFSAARAAASGRAFTLIELCVVMAIAVLLMGVAIPSLAGQAARQRLQESFDRLNVLVSQAREKSMTEGKPYLLAWNKEGTVSLYPAELNNDQRKKQGATAAMFPDRGSEHYKLFRPNALTNDPSAEWTFWPTGTCEPVIVEYAGHSGEWKAAYSPLSGRGVLTRFIAH